ncbi:MAG: EAL domain-containing protein [Rubrivivax sp.]
MIHENLEASFGPLDGIDLPALLAQAGEAVVYVDRNWVVRYCNDVYLANLGMTRQDVIGRTPFEYQPLFNRSIFYDSIENCRRERKPFAKIGYSTVLGRWMMVRVFPVFDGMMMLANDASESVVKQYHLAAQAVKDTLTGLPNKLGLVQDVEALLKRGEAFSLAILGLDRFTSVNDALGYAGGDMVLLEMASRLQSGSIAGESIYRLSGDEFALLNCNAVEGCAVRVQALQALAEQAVTLNGQSFVVGYSAGAVKSPADGGDAELLLKRAGLALRQAKRDGMRTVAFYQVGQEAQSRLRVELEAELRLAIKSRQFMLMLQPQGCLTRGTVVGAEALIRWAHPKRGILSPAEFLPLAQECGLMRQIDQVVLEQAVAMISEMKRAGLEMLVSINLSVDSLADTSLVDRVSTVLSNAGIEARWLEVEIPEGALMKDVDVSASVLEGLSQMGVRISIDDFGTGYSSFAYLARFPVHALKIDRSFVSGMASNESSHKIVKGMVRLAQSLQMSVIAEGAETQIQIDMLRALRCDVVQGFGYARPMPLDNFVAFAQARKLPRSSVRALTI